MTFKYKMFNVKKINLKICDILVLLNFLPSSVSKCLRSKEEIKENFQFSCFEPSVRFY